MVISSSISVSYVLVFVSTFKFPICFLLLLSFSNLFNFFLTNCLFLTSFSLSYKLLRAGTSTSLLQSFNYNFDLWEYFVVLSLFQGFQTHLYYSKLGSACHVLKKKGNCRLNFHFKILLRLPKCHNFTT